MLRRVLTGRHDGRSDVSETQLNEAPSIVPIPYVTAAASAPSRSWRAAENATVRPLNSAVSAPIAASAAALAAAQASTARLPVSMNSGNTVTSAPMANSAHDFPAAPHGLPPSSRG